MNWLLLFVPATVALEHLAPERYLLIFAASCLAILPLAGVMGRATEELAEHMGEGVGGLLNATFGNAAELIIALAALRAGLHDVVKASIAGSIVGNILLVLGAAMLAGGLRHSEQHFNPAGARSQATMLTLAAIALILPAAFQAATGATAGSLGRLSVAISVVLLVVYLLSLAFALITHPALFAGSHSSEEGTTKAPIGRAAMTLGAATVGVAWMSEIMVGAIEPTAHELGLSNVGVFVVAILGNAAEHATAVTAAMKDRMDLALSIAIGSSVQIALFVAPVLVLASLVLGPAPMDLAFPAGLVLTVLLAVLITGEVAGDGRSDWLKGAQLLAVYLVLGLTFFFLPGASPHCVPARTQTARGVRAVPSRDVAPISGLCPNIQHRQAVAGQRRLATTVVSAVSHIPLRVPLDEVNVKAFAAAFRTTDHKVGSIGIVTFLLQGEGFALALLVTVRRWQDMNRMIVREQCRAGARLAHHEAKDASIRQRTQQLAPCSIIADRRLRPIRCQVHKLTPAQRKHWPVARCGDRPGHG